MRRGEIGLQCVGEIARESLIVRKPNERAITALCDVWGKEDWLKKLLTKLAEARSETDDVRTQATEIADFRSGFRNVFLVDADLRSGLRDVILVDADFRSGLPDVILVDADFRSGFPNVILVTPDLRVS